MVAGITIILTRSQLEQQRLKKERSILAEATGVDLLTTTLFIAEALSLMVQNLMIA